MNGWMEGRKRIDGRMNCKDEWMIEWRHEWRGAPPPSTTIHIVFVLYCVALTEILGAFISVMSIWIVTGVLVYLAIERIIRNDYEIDGHVMLITSACAVIVNIM